MYFEIENAIIEKAAAGDMGCFEKIVCIYEKTIFNVCLRFLRDGEDARDTAQEVFIKIYRNLNKFNFKCKFSTWVYRIAVNACIDALRRKKSEPDMQPLEEASIRQTGANPADAVISKDMLRNVEKAIVRLKEDYRTVIVLRDVMGFSYQDISEITGITSGTVKSRISRAREILKLILINDFRINGTQTGGKAMEVTK